VDEDRIAAQLRAVLPDSPDEFAQRVRRDLALLLSEDPGMQRSVQVVVEPPRVVEKATDEKPAPIAIVQDGKPLLVALNNASDFEWRSDVNRNADGLITSITWTPVRRVNT
jgi:hypothetical protein